MAVGKNKRECGPAAGPGHWGMRPGAAGLGRALQPPPLGAPHDARPSLAPLQACPRARREVSDRGPNRRERRELGPGQQRGGSGGSAGRRPSRPARPGAAAVGGERRQHPLSGSWQWQKAWRLEGRGAVATRGGSARGRAPPQLGSTQGPHARPRRLQLGTGARLPAARSSAAAGGPARRAGLRSRGAPRLRLGCSLARAVCRRKAAPHLAPAALAECRGASRAQRPCRKGQQPRQQRGRKWYAAGAELSARTHPPRPALRPAPCPVQARRRLWTPSARRTGMTSRRPAPSTSATWARPWSPAPRAPRCAAWAGGPGRAGHARAPGSGYPGCMRVGVAGPPCAQGVAGGGGGARCGRAGLALAEARGLAGASAGRRQQSARGANMFWRGGRRVQATVLTVGPALAGSGAQRQGMASSDAAQRAADPLAGGTVPARL